MMEKNLPVLNVALHGLLICLPLLAAAAPAFGQAFPEVDALPSRADLPDALTMFDGSPVRTADDWREKRRPELMALFQHYMYGYAPAPPGVTTKVTLSDQPVLDGRATLREVEIRFNGLPPEAPAIHLALFLPVRADESAGPAPVFLGLNSCGNFTVAADQVITIRADAWTRDRCPPPTDEGRGAAADFWCVDYLIERGYGFATFHESDIDPDQHDFSDGVHPFYADLPGPESSRWGTIAAWAWGLRRAVDYLVTDADVDRGRIAVIGHSRRGKTALLAGAFDERIALVVPHQSGTGGAALSRDNDQETVERINRVFPHWFNDAFNQFNDREEKLPFDQHLLMALVAPRALLETAGLQDEWANYERALVALREADKVYKFLGAGGIAGGGVLEGDQPINAQTTGNLAQYRLDSPHTLNRAYWRAILDFADVQFERR